MRYIITAFDYTKYPHRPIISLVLDKTAKFYEFYLKGTKKKITDVEKSIIEFKQYFNEPCIINDFKSHIRPFKLDYHTQYKVYDPAIPVFKLATGDDPKVILKSKIKQLLIKPEDWMTLRSNASIVYQAIEDRGIKYFESMRYPKYELTTFSGRSKTVAYNIQGTTENDNIRSIYDDRYFINLDWIAADLRMVAIMSKDKTMLDSFKSSDPYTFITEQFKNEYTRDEIKTRFLKSFYSLDFDCPIFELFPTFQKYCKEKYEFLQSNNYLYSNMGRKYIVDENNKRSELSVFNSQFQGSVAHSMQNVLIKLWNSNPMSILTEMHDSVVLSCHQKSLSELVKIGSSTMFDSNVEKMPLKVSVGNEWKKWKKFKEIR